MLVLTLERKDHRVDLIEKAHFSRGGHTGFIKKRHIVLLKATLGIWACQNFACNQFNYWQTKF